MSARWILIAALALGALAAPARADTVTVGVFVPSAPFTTNAARVELATRIAKQLGDALGADGIGRVYGRAGDFAAAVRRGELQLAIVDAGYQAIAGGGAVIATGLRGGDDAPRWQLVARAGVRGVLDLQGKRLLVPAVGGRELDFALDVIYGGELPRTFFARVDAAPDTASALAALGLGKADAAIVPAGAALPSGVSAVGQLAAVSGPMLVAYGLDDARRAQALAAALEFHGLGVLTGFHAGGADAVRALGRRFSAPVRRGPMIVPSVRLGFDDLLAGRHFAIAPTPVTKFVAPAPPAR